MNAFRFGLLLLGGAVLAAAPTSGADRFQSMKIKADNLPRFPPALVARGITEGLVRVAARVDEQGKLEEWLVIAYTHPMLARYAVDALQDLEFTPARLDGEPAMAQTVIDFNLRVDGVVVSQNMVDHFLATVSGRTGPELVYAPCTLRELDRIPTPVHVVSPYYDTTLAERGLHGEVTIDFFIDEQGRVRMPVIEVGEQQELAALALEAVRQWTFEPPTRRGEPVLVQARQRFRFAPPAASPAAEN